MDYVTVKRLDLLTRVKKNRGAHRDLFLKAQKGYRKAVIKELDQMLQEAKEGKPIRRAIQLPEPEDHTADYDRVIDMLEMSIHSTIQIAEHEFDQYVRDNWEWKAMATSTTYSTQDKQTKGISFCTAELSTQVSSRN